jgi:hypothetical protein
LPEPEAEQRYSRPDEAEEQCVEERARKALQELRQRARQSLSVQPQRDGPERLRRVLLMEARQPQRGAAAERL